MYSLIKSGMFFLSSVALEALTFFAAGGLRHDSRQVRETPTFGSHLRVARDFGGFAVPWFLGALWFLVSP